MIHEAMQEGRQRLHGGERGLQLAGTGAHRGEFSTVDRLGQRRAGRKVPVERARAHAGQPGEVVETQVEATVGEQLTSLGEQGVTVASGVGTQRLGCSHPTLL